MVMVVVDLMMAHSKTRSHYHSHYCVGGSVAVAVVVVVPVGGAVVVVPVADCAPRLSAQASVSEYAADKLWATCLV